MLRIEGICVLGGLEVKRKSRKSEGARRGKGVNASLEANPVPVFRVKPADRDE